MGEGAVDDPGVDLTGFAEVGEGGFEWEGVGLQPGEEGRGAEDAGVGVLGSVDVGVCGLSGEAKKGGEKRFRFRNGKV